MQLLSHHFLLQSLLQRQGVRLDIWCAASATKVAKHAAACEASGLEFIALAVDTCDTLRLGATA